MEHFVLSSKTAFKIFTQKKSNEFKRENKPNLKSNLDCAKLGLIWFERIISFATAACCLYYSYAFIREYLTYPSVQILEIDTTESIEFPTVTICNLNKIKKSKLCNPISYLEQTNESLKLMSEMIEMEATRCKPVPNLGVLIDITPRNKTMVEDKVTNSPMSIYLTNTTVQPLTIKSRRMGHQLVSGPKTAVDNSKLITSPPQMVGDLIFIGDLPKTDPKKESEKIKADSELTPQTRSFGSKIGTNQSKPQLKLSYDATKDVSKTTVGQGFQIAPLNPSPKIQSRSFGIKIGSHQSNLRLGLPNEGTKDTSKTPMGQENQNDPLKSSPKIHSRMLSSNTGVNPSQNHTQTDGKILNFQRPNLDIGKIPQGTVVPIILNGVSHEIKDSNQKIVTKKDPIGPSPLTMINVNETSTRIEGTNRFKRQIKTEVVTRDPNFKPMKININPKGNYYSVSGLALCNLKKAYIPTHLTEQVNFNELYGKMDSKTKYYLGHDYNDTVKECSFNGKTCFGSIDVNSLLNNEFGICNQLRLKNSISRSLGINSGLLIRYDLESQYYTVLSKQTAVSYALRLVFNHPKTVAVPENEGFLVHELKDNYFALKQVEYRRLKAPYEDQCYNYTDGTHPYQNRKECFVHCAQKLTIKRCNCSDPNWPKIGDERQCSLLNQTEACCIINVLEDINVHKEECFCPLPCREDIYTVSHSSARLENLFRGIPQVQLGPVIPVRSFLEGKFRVYFESLDKMVYSSVPKYSALDVLSNLGGQLGLWLGLSLMTLANSAVSSVFLKILTKKEEQKTFKTKVERRSKRLRGKTANM